MPIHGIAIECQGIQHFKPIEAFGGDKTYNDTVERDKVKLELCKRHNVPLIYYDSQHGYKTFLGENVFNDAENIIRKIKKQETN